MNVTHHGHHNRATGNVWITDAQTGEDDWEERTKPNVWYDRAERLTRAGWVKQRPADD